MPYWVSSRSALRVVYGRSFSLPTSIIIIVKSVAVLAFGVIRSCPINSINSWVAFGGQSDAAGVAFRIVVKKIN